MAIIPARKNPIGPGEAKQIASLWLLDKLSWVTIYEMVRGNRKMTGIVKDAVDDFLSARTLAETTYESLMKEAAERFVRFQLDPNGPRLDEEISQVNPLVEAWEGRDLTSREVKENQLSQTLAIR